MGDFTAAAKSQRHAIKHAQRAGLPLAKPEARLLAYTAREPWREIGY